MSSRELTPKKFFAPRSPFRQGWGRARPRERAARRHTPCYSLKHVCRTLAAHLDLPCLQIRQPRLPSPCGATTPCLQPPPSLPSLARRQVGDPWTRRLCQTSEYPPYSLTLYLKRPCIRYRGITYAPVSIEFERPGDIGSQTLLIQGHNISPCSV